MRAYLRRQGLESGDIDDLLQDAYCRIASLTSIDRIERPGAYLMQTIKNIRIDGLRRARVVRFDELTENAQRFVEGEEIGLESVTDARLQLQLIERILETLPERCRTIFVMKRIDGLAQREIAQRLGVTEHIVENDVRKGLRLIQKALRSPGQNLQEDVRNDGPARRVS